MLHQQLQLISLTKYSVPQLPLWFWISSAWYLGKLGPRKTEPWIQNTWLWFTCSLFEKRMDNVNLVSPIVDLTKEEYPTSCKNLIKSPSHVKHANPNQYGKTIVKRQLIIRWTPVFGHWPDMSRILNQLSSRPENNHGVLNLKRMEIYIRQPF